MSKDLVARPNTVLDLGGMKRLFDAAIPQLRAALPVVLKGAADRFARIALTEFSKNPAIAQCTGLSILGTCIQAAQLGLELGGALGQAYMVPYYNKNIGAKECQFQIGYRGLISLAQRSEQVGHVSLDTVREGDKFYYQRGTTPRIDHIPSQGERGEITHVYSIIFLRHGGFDFEVMTTAEVDEHRKRYSKARTESTPWNTAWEEMARKTPCRKLMKRAPVSVEALTASNLSEMDDEGVAQNLAKLVNTRELALAEAAEVRTKSDALADQGRAREPGEEG